MLQSLGPGGGKFYFAVTGKGVTTFTTNPTLFEVFWYPFLLTVYHRGFKHESDLHSTVGELWELWKEDHLPWRLRARLVRATEWRLKLMRENTRLRLKLHQKEGFYDL